MNELNLKSIIFYSLCIVLFLSLVSATNSIINVRNNTIIQKITEVDTTAPIINSFNYTITGKNILFMFNITEKNFEKISYIDLNDLNDLNMKEILLCSRLNKGICKAKKEFKNKDPNLIIKVFDDSGNFIEKRLGACEWRQKVNYSSCDMVLGYYYNGQRCISLSDCSNKNNKIPFASQNACNIECLN